GFSERRPEGSAALVSREQLVVAENIAPSVFRHLDKVFEVAGAPIGGVSRASKKAAQDGRINDVVKEIAADARPACPPVAAPRQAAGKPRADHQPRSDEPVPGVSTEDLVRGLAPEANLHLRGGELAHVIHG